MENTRDVAEVLYWSVGTRHAEHFVVSLLSLREHWGGQVTVAVGCPDSRRLAEQLHASRLGPLVIVDLDYQSLKQRHRRNAHYLAKCLLHYTARADQTVFLDLDTLVLGDFRDVFPRHDELVLTQFASWETTGSIMAQRIKQFAPYCPREAELMLKTPHPALNTGVFGFAKKHTGRFFRRWRTVTERNVCFMADELSMQLLYLRHPHRVLDDRWNWSPRHSKHGEDVRIAHGHGYKFHKTAVGQALWVPYYRRAIEENIADIRSWTPTAKFRPYYK